MTERPGLQLVLFVAALAAASLLLACNPSPPEPIAEVEAGPVEVELVDLHVEPAEASAPTPLPGDPLLRREALPHHDPRFHDHYQEAMIHLEEGETGDAVDALRMAIFDAPDSAVAWQALGETYLGLGRRGQAISCVKQALVHDRDLLPAHDLMARHLLREGEPKKARSHAQHLVNFDPESADAHFLQARTYLGLAMWDQAIDASRRSIARDPQAAGPYNALGFAALQLGRNGLALQYLEAVTELPGVKAHMLNNLGIAYERSDRDLDALEAYAQAGRMRPGYTTAVANRDRVRELVDRELADEVARILSERVGEAGSSSAALSLPAGDDASP